MTGLVQQATEAGVGNDERVQSPPFDLPGAPTRVPRYQQGKDWLAAVIGQLRLIRGVRGKLRAVGTILLRLHP